VHREVGETDEEYERRKAEAHEGAFVGAAVVSQAVMFNTHPTGRMSASERLTALMEPGGITDCGNAQNCVRVCPKEIPLLRSIAQAGRQTTVHAIRRWLTR
jgi:succinate dehydrogenase / fumarate reductase iron-sulfur subunit